MSTIIQEEWKMNENIVRRNELLGQTIIKGLEKRNMKGFYAADKDEARKIALSLIDEGASVTMGGCMSAHEIGLIDALNEGNYNYIDRDKLSNRKEAAMAAFGADVFLSSANAMTQDGILVNIDGFGNRVAATASGPDKVIFIVSMNKVCSDLDSAIKRARNVAAPCNAQRFEVNTPCKKVGHCMDCTSPDCICGQILITRFSMLKDRIHVVLCGEDLGF